MAFDARKNFAISTVATAPSPATTGTSLVVNAGDGVKFATPPFNAVVWPAGVQPTTANAEIVRVTAIATDTFTIVRTQESSSARTVVVGDQIMAGLTSKSLTDIESAITAMAGTQSLIRNETPAGTINGSNVTFTVASAPATNSLMLYQNGVRLSPTNDYTLSASTITMVAAPPTGAILRADYEVGNSAYSVGTNSIITDETPTGLVNGSNTSFTASRAYIGGALEVYINGVKQVRTTHFTETTPSSGTFTMSDAPLTGDVISINYQFNLNPSSNADTVDGIHASSTATANQLLSLNSSARLPAGVAPILLTAGMVLVPPASATTYYATAGAGSATAEFNGRFYMPMAGTITSCYVNAAASGTTGSSETSSMYIRLNNTTDTLVSSAIVLTSLSNVYSNTSLSIAVNAGDFIAFKFVTPTWATVPGGIALNYVIKIN